MDRMSAFCQFLAQLGTDYAAAAVSWVNRDAYVHFSAWSLVLGLWFWFWFFLG
jgi:hypothetical protein